MKLCPNCTAGYHDSHNTCPTHGGVLSEIRELKPGMVVHKTYRIVRKLGRGGMGIVYLADQTYMREQRALKFLSPELCEDEAFTNRFRQEVRALRLVRHRNVVDCGDLEPAEDDSLFFAMEFVEGPNVREFLDQSNGPLDVHLALAIARGVAEGLSAAHAMGMVHRDIKPENILMARVGDAWVPKIADFGIVASKEGSFTRTRTGGTLLTPPYAAPEQWRGTRAKDLDGRTDLYALGGVLFEMLTGQTAFDAESYEGWAEQHKNVAPQPPSELRPELKRWHGLDALVLRLLAKETDARPRNAAEALGLLGAVTYVEPATARETIVELPPVNHYGETVVERQSPQTVKPAPQPIEQPIPPPASEPGKPPRWLWMVGVALLVAAAFGAGRIIGPQGQRSGQDSNSQTLQADNPTQPQPQNQGGGQGAQQTIGTAVPQPPPSHPAENPSPVEEKHPAAPVPAPRPTEQPNPSLFSLSPETSEKQGEDLYTQKHYTEAAPLFDQACAGGNARACNYLGYMYDNHLGVSLNYPKAAALYQKSCDGDNLYGCANMGEMYLAGRGIALNYAKALSLSTRACNGNVAAGCNNEGEVYYYGHGVASDMTRAFSLYTKGCDGNIAQGCFNLGYMYQYGHGTTIDLAKAKDLYHRSCSMDDQVACDQLKTLQ